MNVQTFVLSSTASKTFNFFRIQTRMQLPNKLVQCNFWMVS